MRIQYVNNDGGGFAGPVEIANGTTIESFFRAKMAGSDPAAYKVRVNGARVGRGHILQEGEKVTITPAKIEGA